LFDGAKEPTKAAAKEPLAAIAHDARNVVAALRLYCDLLAEPGVLSEGAQHFAAELRAVATASTDLVEKLTALRVDADSGSQARHVPSGASSFGDPVQIDDLGVAVEQLQGPLSALAGPKIKLEMECLNCHGTVRLSQEGLVRILINLTRNAAEAMPHGGRIRITVQQGDGGSFLDIEHSADTVLLCVQDSGPGIPRDQIEHLFDAGFTTKAKNASGLLGTHRGLGLSIVRRFVEGAGGNVRAVAAPGGGARFEVELPLIHRSQHNMAFIADFSEGANLEC